MPTVKTIRRTKMKHKVIAISGTPGTGKSTLAILLEKKISYYRLDLHKYYKELSIGYDKKKQCYDLDLKKVIALVKKTKKEHPVTVIDSHISHLLPSSLVDLCIVLSCSNIKKLGLRLKERKYSLKKIRENLDAEIFQICLGEAHDNEHKVITFDTAKRITQKEFVDKIKLNMSS